MLKLGTHNSMTYLSQPDWSRYQLGIPENVRTCLLKNSMNLASDFLIFVFVLMKRQHLILLMAFWNFMKRQ